MDFYDDDVDDDDEDVDNDDDVNDDDEINYDDDWINSAVPHLTLVAL